MAQEVHYSIEPLLGHGSHMWFANKYSANVFDFDIDKKPFSGL